MILSIVIMLVLSLALSWLPVLGPLLAGLAGGYYAGTVGRALAAALLPALALGVFVWWVGAWANHAVAGFFVGVGLTMLLVAHEVGLVVGAVIGGAISRRRGAAPHRV